ncbi:glutamine--fructose-6-phosphate aminotransferase [Syntrophotalea carbinolica DSM 2380]|uniref:Glutamine--fructose-6-phosphate aminotransferase [isomerizing] n=1 Tax=Syntrophotalea carbinolica (strain DSM 2380 / NBRC 103641 / GraBd1) TaxID=338963 RepID=Q3A0D9_SYNC1|nr:glutamine--fructose-6-phosphate transaminase (isomerizing) [Syntrophotalea carbinolica]ABA90168.1 glutamine--fructose-6-phosphate aminotransferase [Syntrophotalea carbinolica DSM 2380]
MCGIVGYIGPQEAMPIIIDGLRRLEYRGYDSAGIAVLNNGQITIRRAKGKLCELENVLKQQPLTGGRGIGHTRWATHGRPSETNAHPHYAGNIAVVHNGIIENYLELKARLISQGHEFTSETDTEIIAHLVDQHLRQCGDFETAVRHALAEVRGAYAVAILCECEPEKLIAARLGSPLVVGQGQGEFFVASDIPAMLSHTREMIFLDEGEIVVFADGAMRFTDLQGAPVEKTAKTITWNPLMAEKGGYKHFMLKEIYEQPRAIADTLAGRVFSERGEVFLEGLNLDAEQLRGFDKLNIVACGTSWHAALSGKFLIEKLARLSVEVDIASEFRYRDPLVDERTLTVLISQSGETADTLAALREAKGKGGATVAICNVVESSIARESDGVIYTHAGPEIGVASTKAFTTQLVALYLLALHLGRVRGMVDAVRCRELIEPLLSLPRKMEQALEADELIQQVAKEFMHARDFLYLGRGIQYPIALEGALKLKEISYVHAEGYPAGEMKHGPIALIDENVPVVFLCPHNDTFEKVVSNMEEVRARSGRVVAVATEGYADPLGKVDALITVPETADEVAPILTSIPMQLLAYHIAVLKGTDVDQPRNLAKSVTVE